MPRGKKTVHGCKKIKPMNRKITVEKYRLIEQKSTKVGINHNKSNDKQKNIK